MDGIDRWEFLESKEIRLATLLKLNQLQREQLPSLTFEHVWNTLKGYTWALYLPTTIHGAINDIMKLTIGEILIYLSNQVIVEGSRLKIGDVLARESQ